MLCVSVRQQSTASALTQRRFLAAKCRSVCFTFIVAKLASESFCSDSLAFRLIVLRPLSLLAGAKRAALL
eukprot:4824996-Pyramimonas_sp.AAC.1